MKKRETDMPRSNAGWHNKSAALDGPATCRRPAEWFENAANWPSLFACESRAAEGLFSWLKGTYVQVESTMVDQY